MKVKVVVRIILCFVLAIMIGSLISMKIDIAAVTGENEAIQAQIDEQTLRNNELEDLLRIENRADLYRIIAEDSQNYVYPDEIVYIDITGH